VRLSSSSASVDADLAAINATSNSLSSSSYVTDQVISGLAGAITTTTATLGDLTAQITTAKAQIGTGTTNPNNLTEIDPVSDEIRKKISALDINYNNETNAGLSDKRIQERLGELGALYRSQSDQVISAEQAARLQADIAAKNAAVADNRFEGEEEAGAALAALRQLIKEEGQRAVDAVGNIEAAKVQALLGDPKVDNSKLDRYKDRNRERGAEPDQRLDPESAPAPIGESARISAGDRGRSEAREQERALRNPPNGTVKAAIDKVG
jgi:hypothetical protein